MLGECRACGLSKTRKNIVRGEGPESPRLVVVGEAPGKNEDAVGRPFIGRSGALLRETLSKAGIPPDDVFFTNTVLCRPPDERNPSKDRKPNTTERDACAHHLLDTLFNLSENGKKSFHVLAVGNTAYDWFFTYMTEFSEGERKLLARLSGYPERLSFGEEVERSLFPDSPRFGLSRMFSAVREGTEICVSVSPVWHPSYVLRGGGGKVTREKFLDAVKILERFLWTGRGELRFWGFSKDSVFETSGKSST